MSDHGACRPPHSLSTRAIAGILHGSIVNFQCTDDGGSLLGERDTVLYVQRVDSASGELPLSIGNWLGEISCKTPVPLPSDYRWRELELLGCSSPHSSQLLVRIACRWSLVADPASDSRPKKITGWALGGATTKHRCVLIFLRLGTRHQVLRSPLYKPTEVLPALCGDFLGSRCELKIM